MDATPEQIAALASVKELEYKLKDTMNLYGAFLTGAIRPHQHELPALKHLAEKINYLHLYMQNIVTGHR